MVRSQRIQWRGLAAMLGGVLGILVAPVLTFAGWMAGPAGAPPAMGWARVMQPMILPLVTFGDRVDVLRIWGSTGLLIYLLFLVELRLLTPQQLERVLVEQTGRVCKRRQPVHLGEVLVVSRLIQRAQLKTVLAVQRDQATSPVQEPVGATVPLGEFLVQQQVVTPAQLGYALKQQGSLRQQGRPAAHR